LEKISKFMTTQIARYLYLKWKKVEAMERRQIRNRMKTWIKTPTTWNICGLQDLREAKKNTGREKHTKPKKLGKGKTYKAQKNVGRTKKYKAKKNMEKKKNTEPQKCRKEKNTRPNKMWE